MNNVIEKNNLDWKSTKIFKIKYFDWQNKERAYFPDFIINNKIIEIKPKKLAAEKLCQNLKMKYELIDPDLLTDKEIIKLYLENKIKFLPRYEVKFKQKYLK